MDADEPAPAVPPRGAEPPAPSAQPKTDGPAGKVAGVDLDAIVQAVQERVVQQIERRGGRYAGLF